MSNQNSQWVCLKQQFTPKLNNLLTPISFQTSMTSFILWSTKKYILKNHFGVRCCVVDALLSSYGQKSARQNIFEGE